MASKGETPSTLVALTRITGRPRSLRMIHNETMCRRSNSRWNVSLRPRSSSPQSLGLGVLGVSGRSESYALTAAIASTSTNTFGLGGSATSVVRAGSSWPLKNSRYTRLNSGMSLSRRR